MKTGLTALILSVAALHGGAAFAQICTVVGGTHQSIGEFIPSTPTSYWPTGTGGTPSAAVAAHVFSDLRAIARGYRPHSWAGSANIALTKGRVTGTRAVPRMDLTIDMGTPFGIDERDGTFHAELSSCRASCPGNAPGHRIMMNTSRSTAGLMDNSTPPQPILYGVAYDFCFEPDPSDRPGWTRLHTYAAVFRGPHYNDRLNQFLLEQAGSFRQAFHNLYGRAHDDLMADEIRNRDRRDEALATTEEAPPAESTAGQALAPDATR